MCLGNNWLARVAPGLYIELAPGGWGPTAVTGIYLGDVPLDCLLPAEA